MDVFMETLPMMCLGKSYFLNKEAEIVPINEDCSDSQLFEDASAWRRRCHRNRTARDHMISLRPEAWIVNSPWG